MDIDLFLKPTGAKFSSFPKGSLGAIVEYFSKESGLPSLDGKHLAIIGVEEDRGADSNDGCAHAPDVIREHFYSLYPAFSKDPAIIDLGNIKKGQTIQDTYFAVSEVVRVLMQHKLVPIVLGGSHDLTYALYRAYEKMEQIVNLVTVDKKLDLDLYSLDQQGLDNISNEVFLNHIITHQPSFLFNYTNIGYQTYFENPEALQWMNKLHFDLFRLGEVNGAQISETEPILRNADLVSFDISAVRYADAPGNKKSSPNGFYGEEFCQLARYAGMGDKVSSVGFFEYNPTLDGNNFQTAQLVAQAMWYFIEGFYNRRQEHPVVSSEHFLKYRVVLEENGQEIVFFKSVNSDRWWMEVPYPTGKSTQGRHYMIPCSYNDYQKACNDGIPDRWWKTFQKLM